MQGQRNSIKHFTDVFGFDIGSSSGNPVIDQQSYWNNIIGSVESQNLEGHQTNHSDSAIQYGNEAHQDGGVLGVGRLHLGRGQTRRRESLGSAAIPLGGSVDGLNRGLGGAASSD